MEIRMFYFIHRVLVFNNATGTQNSGFKVIFIIFLNPIASLLSEPRILNDKLAHHLLTQINCL